MEKCELCGWYTSNMKRHRCRETLLIASVDTRDPERNETQVERLTRERDEWRKMALEMEQGYRSGYADGLRHDRELTVSQCKQRERLDKNLRAVFGTAFPED